MIRKSRFLILCGALAGFAPAHAAETMFHDDFESGFSSKWLSVGTDIEIVADPGSPSNHVAAVPPGAQNALHGPPVANGNWKGAIGKEAELNAWADYELSFRYRLEKAENRPDAGPGHAAAFLRVGTRINPVEENPQEQRLIYLGIWRNALEWRIKTPLIPWYGKDEPMEFPVEIRSGKVDSGWHEVRVVNQGERTEVYFDGTLKYAGSDDRAMRGGFNLLRWSDARLDVGMLYIDDVKVTRIESPSKE